VIAAPDDALADLLWAAYAVRAPLRAAREALRAEQRAQQAVPGLRLLLASAVSTASVAPRLKPVADLVAAARHAAAQYVATA
jgi:hypothetical protein